MKLTAICDKIIRGGFYLLFFLVPLILTPVNYELFEYNKMMLTYVLATIIISAWILKMALTGKVSIAKTPLDIPIGLFVLFQLVSTLLSMDPHVSWLGYYSRFNGGMWSVITYITLYYAFASNFLNEDIIKHQVLSIKGKTENSDSIMPFLKVILASATLVAIYGFLERLGIDKNLWVQDVQSRVFSTLGQPNWLAAYLAAVIPIAVAMGIKSQISNSKSQISSNDQNPKSQKESKFGNWNLGIVWSLRFVFWSLLTALFFFVLLCTRSRSGLLGFVIADAIFWLLISLKSLNKKLVLIPFGIIHGIFFLIVFFNGSYIPQIDQYLTFKSWAARINPPKIAAPVTPAADAAKPTGPLLEYGGTESGKIRKFVWQAAITAWRSSPKNFLVGTGTETYAWTFFRYRPAGHNLVSEWDFLYNKAHNEYLNYLATTGILGLGSYLLLIGFIIFWILKYQISKIKNQKYISNIKNEKGILTNRDGNLIPDFSIDLPDLIIYGAFSGWISILVTNFFGFSVVIMQIFLFLFPAMIFALSRDPAAQIRSYTLNLSAKTVQIIKPVLIIVMLYTIAKIVLFWQADRLFASGYRLNRSGLAAQAEPLLSRAVALNDGEPLYRDELANTLALLSVSAIESGEASLAGELAKASLSQSDQAIITSPGNVNFWKTRTKIYYAFSAYDPKFNQAAIEALNRALALSPNDPKILYNLAILVAREKDVSRAIELLVTAKTIKPNYRDAYNGLYLFYTDTGRNTDARQIAQEYLELVDPADAEFINRIR